MLKDFAAHCLDVIRQDARGPVSRRYLLGGTSLVPQKFDWEDKMLDLGRTWSDGDQLHT